MNADNRINDELLNKYISGNATDSQIEEVMRWAHEDPANMKELEVLRRLNDEVIWNAGIDAQESRSQNRKTIVRRIASWSVAASILLLVGFSVSFLLFLILTLIFASLQRKLTISNDWISQAI